MSTVRKMTSGHIKVKKGTGHVFYMVTPSHATESVCQSFSGDIDRVHGSVFNKPANKCQKMQLDVDIEPTFRFT